MSIKNNMEVIWIQILIIGPAILLGIIMGMIQWLSPYKATLIKKSKFWYNFLKGFLMAAITGTTPDSFESKQTFDSFESKQTFDRFGVSKTSLEVEYLKYLIDRLDIPRDQKKEIDNHIVRLSRKLIGINKPFNRDNK